MHPCLATLLVKIMCTERLMPLMHMFAQTLCCADVNPSLCETSPMGAQASVLPASHWSASQQKGRHGTWRVWRRDIDDQVVCVGAQLGGAQAVVCRSILTGLVLACSPKASHANDLSMLDHALMGQWHIFMLGSAVQGSVQGVHPD